MLSEDLNSCWLEVLRMRRHISVAMKGMYKSMVESANNTKKEEEGDEREEGEEEKEEDQTFALPPARALNGQRMAPTRKEATTLRQASDGFRRRKLNLRRRRQPRLIKVCASCCFLFRL